MRRPMIRIIVASLLVLCIASCALLLDRLPPAPADIPETLRMCTHSTYDVQYCLGLVPTVPSMYPRLYYSTPVP
ncbi:MAG TPA: hypothetical protein VFT66_12555 [Roseiflexaceae bacterium]|jgi:hypothetical protein|nr:hypothetical protein [Roseiflexaceae bacterium]